MAGLTAIIHCIPAKLSYNVRSALIDPDNTGQQEETYAVRVYSSVGPTITLAFFLVKATTLTILKSVTIRYKCMTLQGFLL